MPKKADQSESIDSDFLDLNTEEIAAASETVQFQIRQAFGLWVAGLECCNVFVRQWTESRKKAVEHAMRELTKADKEPDLDKRAQMVAEVFTEQTRSALKDVLAASIRAVHVGSAYSQRAMKQVVQETTRRSRDSQT